MVQELPHSMGVAEGRKEGKEGGERERGEGKEEGRKKGKEEEREKERKAVHLLPTSVCRVYSIFVPAVITHHFCCDQRNR